MNCKHWTDCGIVGGGCCALGRYGGAPSFGVCRQCPENTGVADWAEVRIVQREPCGSCGDKTNVAQVKASPSAIEAMLAG